MTVTARRFGGLIDDGRYTGLFPDMAYLPGDAPDEAGLFAEPPRVKDPAPVSTGESLGADARRTRRQRALIESGVHPLTRFTLHPQAPPDTAPTGRRPQPYTCGTCTHLGEVRHNRKTYLKCAVAGDTNGPGTDARRWWPACRVYLPIPDDQESDR